ncbi:uncharacterized protein LOC128889065 [Hylaeus anthracinus]|uniref:uncharacterized protein LOC128889065 n=1 Tax=Hylaeus anthracinus TaxID=313031 RepID=UPI0023B9B1F4|nr:uncharacterized protein LOC128889065 [Hylaeus anthracinus]XP_054002357.1 uncharacterized protein LOC128889065 [Hylaeus anthracinus]
MEENVDTFAWVHRLGCPATLCNDLSKQILRKGLIAFLWDDLADVIFTCDETTVIRKNVLLHQLKNGKPDKIVQCIQNISRMKSNRQNSRNQISKLEEEYEQLDFAVRQRVQKLRDTSSKHSQVKVKKQLLKMKYDEINTQLCDCNEMRLICQHLMPNTCTNLDPKLITEMSDIVTSLWAGANKRHVWDTVSNNLDNIEVTTLWHLLNQNLGEAVDTLIASGNTESSDTVEQNSSNGFLSIHGQHISMISKRLLYHANAGKEQQNVLEYIKKIEEATNNSTDVSEWLALSLEVRKLEMEQRNLEKVLDKFQHDFDEHDTLAFDLSELTSEIQDINTKTVEYMQDVQQSLNLLKSSSAQLMKTKEKILLELQKILALRNAGCDSTWLDINSSTTELDTFHNTLDLNALRKIMLKGNVGVYRYTKSCFNEASLLIRNSQISNIMCYFPMIQTPIYSLIECYKNLVLLFVYKKFESLKIDENSDVFQMPMLTNEETNTHIVKLLNLSKAVNTKTNIEIDNFNKILNAWVHQTVQKVMEIIEKTVDDATFPDWVKRYDLSIYMLQNPPQR